jgi:hypothetical protein
MCREGVSGGEMSGDSSFIMRIVMQLLLFNVLQSDLGSRCEQNFRISVANVNY